MGKYALIMISGFVLIFGYIKNNLNEISESSSDSFFGHYERTVAHNISNSAANIALGKLAVNNDWRTGFQDESLFGGTYSVVVQDSSDDASLGVSQLRITATGRIGGASHTDTVIVSRLSLIPPIPSAVAFIGDTLNPIFNGNSFIISGNDKNLGGTYGPGPDLPGIVVSSESIKEGVKNALTQQQEDNVIGAGGSPSVGVMTSSVGDLVSLASIFKAKADNYYPDSEPLTLDPSEMDTLWGTTSNPKITYIENENGVRISGGYSGAGVLVVEGSLTVTGSFYWAGLILIIGNGTIQLETKGTPTFWGTILVDVSPNGSMGFNVDGNVSIQYSSQGIGVARDTPGVNYHQTVSWWE